MGLITEMFLTFEGYSAPEVGDKIRINCIFKGVIRDACTLYIISVMDCIDEPYTVLIKVGELKLDDSWMPVKNTDFSYKNTPPNSFH